MNKIAITDFLDLLDTSNMMTLTFLAEVLKNYNLEGDFFFWEMPKDEERLKEMIRKTARRRKWKLRNLTILHRRHKVLGKRGDFCLMITTKTPEQLANFCNRLHRMRAFL